MLIRWPAQASLRLWDQVRAFLPLGSTEQTKQEAGKDSDSAPGDSLFSVSFSYVTMEDDQGKKEES